MRAKTKGSGHERLRGRGDFNATALSALPPKADILLCE